MRILIVAATAFEVEPTVQFLQTQNLDSTEVLITGVGICNSSYALGKKLASSSYDLLINLGIAGSFSKTVQLGETFQVQEDILSELGAEDGEDFISIDTLGFGQSSYKQSFFISEQEGFSTVPSCEAITVNTVHGHEPQIQKLLQRLPNITLETMEGASFYMAAAQEGIPAIQIRSVSNYVERRNRATWNIPLAIKNANDCVIRLLAELQAIEEK